MATNHPNSSLTTLAPAHHKTNNSPLASQHTTPSHPLYRNIPFYRIDFDAPREAKHRSEARNCGRMSPSLLITALVLLLLTCHGLPGILAQVHNQAGPRLLLVPLEPCQVREVKLVVGLRGESES